MTAAGTIAAMQTHYPNSTARLGMMPGGAAAAGILVAAQFIALWPTWMWMAQRMTDGSDDPLGILALAALGALTWQARRELRDTPWRPGLWIALGFTLLASTAFGQLRPLLVGLLSMVAVTGVLLAFLPQRIAKAPVFGLAVLALPLLSSLQFYAGYPLRVVTAEVSRWLLWPFFSVWREGSTLMIDGQLVIVDAPCSGIQMAWLGYFTACAAALFSRTGNRRFLTRLPFVGCVILAGNIARNSVLVALQANGQSLPEWLHQGIGLVFLALVCFVIARIMQREQRPQQTETPSAQRNENGTGKLSLLYIGVLTLCTLWTGAAGMLQQAGTRAPAQSAAVEWPIEWNGRQLRPLAPNEVEKQFARNFPGFVVRLTDGEQMLVFRHVAKPTRMLHPAVDCYKALGYRIRQERLESDAENRLWRCFTASRTDQDLRVCERIENAAGEAYTDTSAWYWAALRHPERGPWQALVTARAAGPGE